MSFLNIFIMAYTGLGILITLIILFLALFEKIQNSKIRKPFIYLFILGIIPAIFFASEEVAIKCENKSCTVNKSFHKQLSFSLENKPYVQCELPTKTNFLGLDLILHNASDNPIFIVNKNIEQCEKASAKINNYFFSDDITPYKYVGTSDVILLIIASILYFISAIASLFLPGSLKTFSNIDKVVTDDFNKEAEKYAKDNNFYNDIIYQDICTYYKKCFVWGGFLYLTNNKLYFKSYNNVIPRRKFDIDLSGIKKIEIDSSNPNILFIYTTDTEPEKIQVQYGKIWIEYLKTLCPQLNI